MVRVLFAWRICSRVLVGLSYVNRLFLAFLNNWTLDQQRFGGATVPWLACRFGCGFRASNRSPVENLFRRRSLRDYFLLERLSRSCKPRARTPVTALFSNTGSSAPRSYGYKTPQIITRIWQSLQPQPYPTTLSSPLFTPAITPVSPWRAERKL